RLRVRPCRARFWRSSSGRSTRTTLALSSKTTRMLGCTACASLPLGPSTATCPSLIDTLTPPGTATRCLPTRDIAVPPDGRRPEAGGSLPDRGEQLAAEVLRPGPAVAHDALAGADDADAQAVQHRPELRVPPVEAPPRAAGPLDVLDHALALGP